MRGFAFHFKLNIIFEQSAYKTSVRTPQPKENRERSGLQHRNIEITEFQC